MCKITIETVKNTTTVKRVYIGRTKVEIRDEFICDLEGVNYSELFEEIKRMLTSGRYSG